MPIILKTGYTMRISGYCLQRLISGFLIFLLTAPFGETAGAQQQQTPPNPQTEGTSSSQTQPSSDHEIEKTATDTAHPEASQDRSGSVNSQTTDAQRSNSAQPAATESQKNDASEPQ